MGIINLMGVRQELAPEERSKEISEEDCTFIAFPLMKLKPITDFHSGHGLGAEYIKHRRN